jgi:hypothetical protein
MALNVLEKSLNLTLPDMYEPCLNNSKTETCWLGTSQRELFVGPCHHGPLKSKHWNFFKHRDFNFQNQD